MGLNTSYDVLLLLFLSDLHCYCYIVLFTDSVNIFFGSVSTDFSNDT